MKIDDVLKAHKLCWTPGEALDDPVCCDGCPYKQYGDACARHLIADTIEVLEECKNINEYDIYFIDGHDLRFKTFQTEAETEDEAIHHLYITYGDFDHTIVAVLEK